MNLPATPPGFAALPPGALETAVLAVREALDPALAVPRLRRYYDQAGEFAGATFVEALAAESTAPDDFTATDLYAITLLTVDPPKPLVARRFLDPGPHRSQLLRLLHSEHLTADIEIAYADDDTMTAMRDLYEAVKSTLGRDPWVTTSKLCARKRPGLYPVRDELVRKLLDVLQYGNYQIDWQIFRAIMLDHEIVESLHSLHEAAQGGTIAMDAYPLRWLDVALWMHARDRWPREPGAGRR
jgi:hypothetical protein